jgi:hypothetical protein
MAAECAESVYDVAQHLFSSMLWELNIVNKMPSFTASSWFF